MQSGAVRSTEHASQYIQLLQLTATDYSCVKYRICKLECIVKVVCSKKHITLKTEMFVTMITVLGHISNDMGLSLERRNDKE